MSSGVRFVNITDGEEATSVDQNRVRDYSRVLGGDMYLGSLFAKSAPGDFLNPFPNAYLFAHGGGGAPYAPAALQVSNFGGLIHQYTSAAVVDGDAPAWLSYWLAGDELLTTLGAGDGANPRIDLIEIKLDLLDETESRDFEDSATGVASSATPVTKKKVRLTKNVVPGTPGASPSEPAGTAGYVPWAFVWVPTSFAGTFSALEVSDMRTPFGFSRIFQQGSYGSPFTANWAQQVTAGNPRKSGGASEDVYFYCPVQDPTAKVIAINVHADANVDMTLYQMNGATPVQLAAGTNTLSLAHGAPTGATTPAAWFCNGLAAADPTQYSSQAVKVLMLQIASRGANTNLYGVSWVLAGTV